MPDFGLELILAEEAQQQPDRGDPEPRHADQSIVIERTNFTTPSPFVIQDGTRAFPIYGVGTVESLLLITEQNDYRITLDLDTPSDLVGEDESAFIDNEHYTDLESISTELASVAAYQADSGNHVLDVGPIDFLDNVRAFVEPETDLTVQRQRAEVTVERRIE